MAMTDTVRADPEDLLAEAEQEGRGRLKIYLGMAPGVGKTYAMLENARRLKAQGLDVVTGVVETHGRADTLVMAQDLETLPRQKIAYRGQALEEFDLDGALNRKPALLLVDELAHTNAPECRHPKRWQDVAELLRAGIDVHTTLNVQHLESLSDVVARITGVRVAETIPDHVLEQAHEIEVIDLTPQDLITRLKEGKVYAPQLVGQAREKFFTPANLTALRELALRRTAERVDSQLVGYMRAHAIQGPWPAAERIMALVGPDGLGSAVVRAANLIADQLKAPFVAVTAERQERIVSLAADASITEALVLAERLGGRIDRLTTADLAGDLLAYARKNNVTQIFIGHARPRWWREIFRRSLVHELIRRARGVAIHVISEAPERRKLIKAESWEFARDAMQYGSGLVSVAAVIVLAIYVRALATSANVAMLFLGAVLFSAVSHGLRPGIATAIAAFLGYNFFFTEPYYTLQVQHWHDLIALCVFLVVAVTTGVLAGRVRNQALAGRARIAALQTLYEFSKRLGAKSTMDELLHAIVLQLHRLTERPTMLLLPQGDDIAIRYAWPPDDQLPERDMAAARWTQDRAEPAGRGTETMPSAAWHFRPLRAGDTIRGVFGLQCDATLRGDLLQTIDAVLDQGAVAIDRIALAADAATVQALAETDRLRSALLSSVSHDLRTPLTSIIGAASALRQDHAKLRKAERDELLETIEEEAGRLDRFVNNLMDMTRLEGGALIARREWVDVEDAIDGALRHLSRELRRREVNRSIDPDVPPASADPVLLETVLVNLIDNALKHGGDPIEVSARGRHQAIFITVSDRGPGIAADKMTKIFDRFYRSDARQSSGTGLGLSISKGLVEAMEGKLTVESPIADGRGTRFTIELRAGKRP